MESLDVRAATLDALRRWAATDRASLVAAAWEAGNRNVSELARTARVGRDAIYADLRAKGIDPTASREEPAVMPTTDEAVDLPVPGWRHPHLLTVRKSRHFDEVVYDLTVKPFTGREVEPEIPQEWDRIHPSEEDEDWNRSVAPSRQRSVEIELVRKAWAQARFKYQVGQLLARGSGHLYRTPTEAWQAYVDAREGLRTAYAALDSTPDNEWKAALLRIVDAKQAAEQAAEQWDDHAREFTALDWWLFGVLGEDNHPDRAIRDTAKEHGVDTTAWLIGTHDEYTSRYYSPPAQAEIKEMIEAGDERIRQVQALSDTGRH